MNSAPCQKWAKRWQTQKDGRHGTFAKDPQTCMSRGRRSTRDIFINDVRRSGGWFPEKGRILEHQIFSFAKMFCVTGTALRMTWPLFFRGRRGNYFRQTEWKNRKTQWPEAASLALHFFQFWRKSCRIASFLMLSPSNFEEVSQNCCVLDLSTSTFGGSLAEFFPPDRPMDRKID